MPPWVLPLLLIVSYLILTLATRLIADLKRPPSARARVGLRLFFLFAAKLRAAASTFTPDAELTRLLDELDAALARMDDGSYGLCEVCGKAIEPERLLADPHVRSCPDHLKPQPRRALEEDPELAAHI